MNTVGIDVSCKELVVVVMVKGKARKAKSFENTPLGHQSIIQSLAKMNGETKVCIEATGIYHFDLAVALSRAEGIEVMVINPKAAHNFAKALMTRSKTDAIEAENSAIYAERMPFVAWECPADECISLRVISRRIAALSKQKTQTKNQLHALESTLETPGLVIDQMEELVVFLEAQIKSLRDNALMVIQQHYELEKAYLLISGIKGIAQASAIQILSEIMILPKDMTARQWVAHAGLDPRIFDSGSSVSKKPRISKVGNKYIRQALYMPALVASRFEPNIKGYYHHLINDNGLKKVQAVCAVMRKLLHAIHGMLRTNKEFDGARFYALPVSENS
ncbi:transposase [Methyloprofundus sedimenti]|uniref:Transposase n=1 Tax=Methyloprofundus sedimenti TaxID=1420851 RepID=A0A1V8M459_9GAMM|nr:IS110 family transposase [Methyloprofundus sedimenti]OQK16355.1 transposase [Methyloprofundus sedimenti]